MGYPKLVVYVRHEEMDGNVMTPEEIHRNQVAVQAFHLTPKGRARAPMLGRYLKKRFGSFDIHFVSTLPRTRETLLAAGLNGPCLEDSRIDETHYGIHHFYPREEIEARFPIENVRKEIVGDYWYRAIGGENWPDIELRAHSFIDMLRRDWSGKKVCIISHANFFAAWRRIIEQRSIADTLAQRGNLSMKNAEVAVYRGQGPWYAPWNRDKLVLTDRVVPWEDTGQK